MLHKRKLILAVIITMLLVGGTAIAAPQTLTGVVTDTMCGKKHMIPGKTDAECTRECMKSKDDSYGLVVGDKVFTLVGDSKQFDALAGRRVKVTGDVAGTKITVQAITAAK